MKMIFKRYYLYARRSQKEPWTDWSQYWTKDKAFEQVVIIKDVGWQARVYDRLKKEDVE